MPKFLPLAVIDNTLLSRLAALDIAEFLPLIFRQILIPPEVRREAYKAPNKRRLRNLLNEQPDFFVICKEEDESTKELLKLILDEGEAAVIAQAEVTKSTVLIDEKKGLKEAVARNHKTLRTTEVLCLLKEAGAIELIAPYLEKLETMGFWISVKVKTEILKDAGEIE